MAELVKPWNDGGNLSVTYDGSGDGEAIFSSDSYEGIDREQSVIFKDVSNSISAERIVRQEGIRQRFITADGKILCVLDGGRFGVLREGGVEPPTPMETYTPLAYIEATGAQYINTGYVVKETDTIEMLYYATSSESGDKMLFYAVDSSNGLWASIASTSGYFRFGSNSSTTVARSYYRYRLMMQKESFKSGTASATLSYTGMPNVPLCLFARNNNGSINAYGKCRCYYFRITDSDGNIVMNLRPSKNAEGVAGLLDMVSGQFFGSESGTEFVAGMEAHLPTGYEVIDYVSFNTDKIFDTGIYINNGHTIETMVHNGNPVSTAKYMYGVITTNHTASVTAYLAKSGTWRFGAANRAINTADSDDHILVQDYNSVTKDNTDYKTSVESGEFTTPYPLPIGGSISETGVYSKQFFGEIFYLKITDSNGIVMYLLPVRSAEGQEGFWDCVTQKFVEPV